MTEFFRLIGEVVRVDTDAMAAHQTGPEFQEIPFRACRLKHFRCVKTHAVKNNRQLIHEGNIQIALGIFDHLRRLGDADARCFENPRFHYRPIGFREPGQCLRRIAGNDFHDAREGVLFVARINTLG